MRKFLTGLFQDGRITFGSPFTAADTHRSDERPPSRLSALEALNSEMLIDARAAESCDKLQGSA